MDRRQQKTREAIYQAFSTLLESKRFENAIERLEQNRVEMEKRNAEAEAALAEVKRKKAEADAFVEMREKEAEKELEMLYEQGIDKSLIEGVEAFRACHTVEEKEMTGLETSFK